MLETRALAAVVGMYSQAAPGQKGAMFSADLGWTFVHKDKLWVLFGDSWWADVPNHTTDPDDALGYISLGDFPDGESVDAFVKAHAAPAGAPHWQAAAPTLTLVLSGGPGSYFAPMLLERDGARIASGPTKTPATGFSNGRDDERAAAFSVFVLNTQLECAGGRCSAGFECDRELGRDGTLAFNPPCLVGGRASCTAGPGFCQDRGSSLYDASLEMGRTQALAVRQEVGVMDEANPARFRTQPWDTHRFFNVTSRTARDFDPSRAHGIGNDYAPAYGNTLPRSGVFLWGRPHFGGIAAQGRDAQLYLAWSPMPVPDAERRFDWKPRYFAGLDAAGRPSFVERELDSKPLDLDAAQSGAQPQELHDIVGQMAISWLPALQRYVMFYGGELPTAFLDAIFRGDVTHVAHDPRGSLYVRFAEHPWGPWTQARELLAAGDVSPTAQASGLYAPGGILAHSNCTAANCARYEPAFRALGGNNNGVLYGANIIDAWTMQRSGEVDLYWYLSTWNPYHVLLMKTTLARGK